MRRAYFLRTARTWALLGALAYGCGGSEFSGDKAGQGPCPNNDCTGDAGSLAAGEGAGGSAGGTADDGTSSGGSANGSSDNASGDASASTEGGSSGAGTSGGSSNTGGSSGSGGSAGGKADGGTSSGGSANGASGNTSGDAGASTEGGSSGAGTNGGSSNIGGSSGSGGSAGGSGGALPDVDYVLLGTTNPRGAVVLLLNAATGELIREDSITNPFDVQTSPQPSPRALVALPDGTLRALWGQGSTAKIVKLGSDLSVIGTTDIAHGSSSGAVAYAKLPDGTGRVMWAGSGAGIVTALTTDDEIDPSAPVTTLTAPAGYDANSYFTLHDGTSRLVWRSGADAIISVLTAEGEPTDTTYNLTGSGVFSCRGYWVGEDATVLAPWTYYDTTSTDNEARLCFYASEDDLGAIPNEEGWRVPGTCWKYPLEQAWILLGYATFRH